MSRLDRYLRPDSRPADSRGAALLRWLDAGAGTTNCDAGTRDRVDWMRVIPFLLMHAVCLFVFVVGVSATAVIAALAMYLVRMFAITAFYHRYFSHRAFK